jgi:hypothetical protein
MSSMYGATGYGSGDKIPKGYKAGQLQQFNPEQMELFSRLASLLGGDSDLFKLASGDQGYFEEMEKPALRQFSGLQGNLASRFSGMGSGARRSSGFQNTINAASSDFAQDLQAKRQGLMREARGDIFNLGSSLLNQRPTQRFLTEKKPSFLESLLGGIGNIGGQFAGSAASSGGTLSLLKLLGLL